jgi:quinolinate synthase
MRRALETMTYEVTVDPVIAERARRSVERMMALG